MKPAWPLGRELCQYEHNVSSTYASRSQTLSTTFASQLLCFSVLQRVHQSCKTSRKLRNGWGVEWEWIFQRKVMFTCRSRSAEFQMTSFFFAEAELRKFKSQYIVLNWGTSSHRLFCVRKQNGWTSRHSIFLVRKRNFKSQDILCAEAELRDLKVKALVWKQNCETSSGTSGTKCIVWKRNCVTSKSQYLPYAEAESGHFRAPKSHTILYADVELRNFKSQYIPCAEAKLQAKEYSMCGSGNAELQVT